jgi:hypothetical protein
MSKAQAGQKGDTDADAIDQPPPLKPRRGLFIALLVALIVWVGFLLVLYFTTVLPREKQQLKPPTTSLSWTLPGALQGLAV